MKYFFSLIIVMITLTGCTKSDNIADLKSFIKKQKSITKSTIKPLPTYSPYEVFAYGAANLRNPFEPPIRQLVNTTKHKNNVKPDLNRTKQLLEEFALDKLSMVGFLKNDRHKYGLVKYNTSIYKVAIGDYIGKNHGRVVDITEQGISLLEIVFYGKDNWIERSNFINLKE